MRSDLFILNDAIAEIIDVTKCEKDKIPQPRPDVLWIYIPQAKKVTWAHDYANEFFPVWVGIKTEYLTYFPSPEELKKSECASIIFRAGAALIVKAGENPPCFTGFQLPQSYRLKEKNGEVKLTLPSHALILPLCPQSRCCPIKGNRTAWVDAKYGNDATAQLENPCKPFRSINAAVQTIPLIDLALPGWLVNVAPGVYPEVVGLPHNIRLLGSGRGKTFIHGLIINGEGGTEVDELTILVIPRTIPDNFGSPQQNALPTTGVAIEVNVGQPGVNVNGVVRLSNLAIEGSLGVIPGTIPNLPIIHAIQSLGMNGIVRLENVRANVDASLFENGHLDIVLGEGVEVQLIQSFSQLMVHPSSTASLVHSREANIIQLDGSSRYQVVDAIPVNENRIFWIEGGRFQQAGHSLDVLITNLSSDDSKARKPRLQQQTNEVIIYHNTTGLIQSTSLDADLSGVPQDLQVYAFAANSNSETVLLQSSFTGDFVPPLRGEKSVIFYFANSEQGNMIGSGGLYTNIQTWSQQFPEQPDSTFVQDNDGTILVDVAGKTILFEEPAEVDEQVLYRGKQVYVVNVSTGDIFISGPIFGGNLQTIPAGEARLLQNDGQLWYIIADRNPPPAPAPAPLIPFTFSAPNTSITDLLTGVIYLGQGAFSNGFFDVAYPSSPTTLTQLSASIGLSANSTLTGSLNLYAAAPNGTGGYDQPISVASVGFNLVNGTPEPARFNISNVPQEPFSVIVAGGVLLSVGFNITGTTVDAALLSPSVTVF